MNAKMQRLYLRNTDILSIFGPVIIVASVNTFKKLRLHWNFTKDDLKDYKCDQCEYTAKQRTHVNRHKLSIHEGMRYHCQKCNYQGKQKSYLGKHINIVHNDLQNLN